MVENSLYGATRLCYTPARYHSAPLERMGKRVAAGQNVDIGHLQSLTKRTRYSVVVAAVAICSLVIGVLIAIEAKRHMEKAVYARSAVEPGVRSC